jgi:hypothetical protein
MGSHRWKNGLLYTLTMLMLAPTLGACASVKTVEWTEDVKLSDGRTIVVQRANDYRRVMDAGAGFQRGWLFQKSLFAGELPPPIQRSMSWEGTLIPLVLDFDAAKHLYFVGVLGTSHSQFEWKVPRGEFHVAFRWMNDGWQQITLSELPRSIKPNLLANTYTLFIDRNTPSGTHVSLKLKEELDSSTTMDRRFREIVRPASAMPKN